MIKYDGYIRYKNLGDEVCYNTFNKEFKKRFPDVDLTPNEKIMYPSYAIWGAGTLLSLIKGFSNNSIHRYVTNNIPYSIFGTGIEPYIYMNNVDLSYKNQLVSIFDNSELICLRDHMSYIRVKQLGVRRDDITIIGDLSFLNYQNKNINKNSGIQNIGLNIGTSINKLYGNNEQHLYTLIERLVNKLTKKYHVYLVPVWPCDIKYQNMIYKKCIHPNLHNINKIACNLQEWKYITKNLDIFIGMKLHSVICSLILDIPCISIAYREKCISIMKMLELENFYVRTDHKYLDSKILYILNNINVRNYLNTSSNLLLKYREICNNNLNLLFNKISERNNIYG